MFYSEKFQYSVQHSDKQAKLHESGTAIDYISTKNLQYILFKGNGTSKKKLRK